MQVEASGGTINLAHKQKQKNRSRTIKVTFCLVSSSLERNFLFLWTDQPELKSGPSVVSAVKECFVPLLDSNRKPGWSSFRIVACIIKEKFEKDQHWKANT